MNEPGLKVTVLYVTPFKVRGERTNIFEESANIVMNATWQALGKCYES